MAQGAAAAASRGITPALPGRAIRDQGRVAAAAARVRRAVALRQQGTAMVGRRVTYRRSMLRVWLAASACWIGFWVWHYATTCRLETMGGGRAIACRWETAMAGGVAVATRTAPALPVLGDMAVRTFGIPLCAIVAGIAVGWVIERIRRRAI